ncbi:bifunctional diguanylate cyclase/phosphodiesterase [Larsenimonas rhizosphaerae]|uniref:bifunctional diguanylate cyclase/phosphodiesterase n=1 Tax=Larsenimonas rhizosphaerae TaxID=2944682 RepID=UPI0020344FD6|nr:EAL domain-containing protein [Larsenimonas rhizosphaerae]MCM2129718.1 EAL domain-containing protein [Larsenimonas rhizosphaerae]
MSCFSTSSIFFISLRLKVFLVTTLVLVFLAFTFFFVSQSELESQLEQRQFINYKKQKLDIINAIKMSRNTLQGYTSMISAVAATDSLFGINDNKKVSAKINEIWPSLQLDIGIDELKILDKEGKVVLEKGAYIFSRNKNENIDNVFYRRWAKESLDLERPVSRLICSKECRQYAFSPILSNGESIGVVVASLSIADVARYINIDGKSDIAILADIKERQRSSYLKSWGGDVVAATNKEETIKKIDYLSQGFSKKEIVDSPVRIKLNDEYYYVMMFPVGDNGHAIEDGGHVVVFSNITDEYESVNKESERAFLIILLGWLFAEAAIFGLLWKPMSSLKKIIEYLPMLAEGKFDDFAKVMKIPGRYSHDEIGVLQRTALAVSGKLQQLQIELHDMNSQLQYRVEDLAKERDFTNSLLSTASALIITHGEKSGVVIANQLALKKTGLRLDNIIGKGFQNTFLNDNDRFNYFRSEFQQEHTLAGNNEIIIEWYHSPLSSLSSEDAYWVSVGVDVTEKKKAESRLVWLANQDSLTGLYNRRFFKERLEESLSNQEYGAVFYLDLDRFKEVNELSGHGSGDKLLCMVADKLKDFLPDECFIARLGGDEFSVLLPFYADSLAIDIASKINDALDEINFIVDKQRHRAVASIGIASYPMHGDNTESIMANADIAMYLAKDNPMVDWHLITEKDLSKENIQHRIYWDEVLKQSLQDDSFEFFAQPIMNVSDNTIKHYELLIRLPDSVGGFFSPGQFIPVAERSGLIIDIDRYVIEKGVHYLSCMNGVSFSINISGKSLRDESLAEFLSKKLEESGAQAERLIVEITETEAVTDFGLASKTLLDIKELGCKVALDDFGSGFSSFRYLDRLPSDFVKIDGEFISGLERSPSNRVIVNSIFEVSRSFGKQVIAEFVDSDEVLDILSEIGVDYAQGYLVGKPEHINKIIRCDDERK